MRTRGGVTEIAVTSSSDLASYQAGVHLSSWSPSHPHETSTHRTESLMDPGSGIKTQVLTAPQRILPAPHYIKQQL